MVLFPGASIPLHVFELRYRTMVRDALSGERVIALALLRPGWERDYYGSPEYHPLGCLARIDEVNWLPDDCYDLRVLGLARARLGRTMREFPYRAVRTEVLPQEPFSEDDALVQLERRALVEAGQRLARAVEPGTAPEPPAAEDLGFEPLVNTICMGLATDPVEKLGLLALDSVIERARRTRELLEEEVLRAGRASSGGGERN